MPKQPVVAALERGYRKRSLSANLLGTIASGLCILALLFTAFMFLYERLLIRRVATLERTLAEAREAFEPAVIEELKRADARMRAAEVLLAGHRAVTPLFTLLEDETLRNVYYTSFEYTASGGPGGKFMLDGMARSFRSVALQADAFGSHPEVIVPLFSNLDQDPGQGFATFDFEAQVGKKLTDYGTSIEGDRAGATQ